MESSKHIHPGEKIQSRNPCNHVDHMTGKVYTEAHLSITLGIGNDAITLYGNVSDLRRVQQAVKDGIDAGMELHYAGKRAGS